MQCRLCFPTTADKSTTAMWPRISSCVEGIIADCVNDLFWYFKMNKASLGGERWVGRMQSAPIKDCTTRQPVT